MSEDEGPTGSTVNEQPKSASKKTKENITAEVIRKELEKQGINDDVVEGCFTSKDEVANALGQISSTFIETYQLINNLNNKGYCLRKPHLSDASNEDLEKLKNMTRSCSTEETLTFLKKVHTWRELCSQKVQDAYKGFMNQLKYIYCLSKSLCHASAQELMNAGVPENVANSGKLQERFRLWIDVEKELDPNSEVLSKTTKKLKRRFILDIDLKTAVKNADRDLQSIYPKMTEEIAKKISNNTVTKWEQLYSEKDRKLHEVFKTLKNNYALRNAHYNNLCDYVLPFQSLSIIPEGHYSPYILQENFKS